MIAVSTPQPADQQEGESTVASWRTECSRAECHKRELPDHEVVISREQTRWVEIKEPAHAA